MATGFERKRDAAFNLLAELGFEWDGKTWAPSGTATGSWLSPEEVQSALVVGDGMREYIAASIAEHSHPGAFAAYREGLIKAAEHAMTTDPVLVAALANTELQAAEAERVQAIRELVGGAEDDRLPDDVVAIELWLAEAWDRTTGCFERRQTRANRES